MGQAAVRRRLRGLEQVQLERVTEAYGEYARHLFDLLNEEQQREFARLLAEHELTYEPEIFEMLENAAPTLFEVMKASAEAYGETTEGKRLVWWLYLDHIAESEREQTFE